MTPHQGRVATQSANSAHDVARPASAETPYGRLALLSVIVLACCWAAWPVWYAPIVAAVGVPCVLLAIGRPYVLCLVFVVLSFFRVQEAYPILYPLHLPLIVGALLAVTLVWHLAIVRSVTPVWSAEIKSCVVFFGLTTLGVAFALNRPLAFAYWSETFWKIGLVTLALAWLPVTPTTFRIAARVFVAAGVAIGLVAIYNRLMHIDLVEGTRVTIGPGSSMLGDPNDLALVLLFPLSFSAAQTINSKSAWTKMAGLIATAIVVWGIVVTQSRGGLIGVLAVLTVVAMHCVRSKLLVLGSMTVGAAVLYSTMNIATRAYSGTTGAALDDSATDRLHTWATALNMVVHRPLTGVGINNFADSYYFFTDYFDGIGRAAHSTWLGVLAETGIPGFIAFGIMIVFCFGSARRAIRRVSASELRPCLRDSGLGILAGLIGFCASGTFLSQGFTWPAYILVALTTSFSRMVDLSIGTVARPPPAHHESSPKLIDGRDQRTPGMVLS